MITPETIYWITRFDYLQGFLMIIGTIGLIGCYLCNLAYFLDEKTRICKRWIIGFAIVSFISSILCCFVPSTNEVLMMYIPTKVIESNKVIKDVDELYDLSINQLKQLLNNKGK